jgi:hypothetical protein
MPQNLHEFKICIRDACECADMKYRPVFSNEIVYRFDVCNIISETHTEIRSYNHQLSFIDFIIVHNFFVLIFC